MQNKNLNITDKYLNQIFIDQYQHINQFLHSHVYFVLNAPSTEFTGFCVLPSPQIAWFAIGVYCCVCWNEKCWLREKHLRQVWFRHAIAQAIVAFSFCFCWRNETSWSAKTNRESQPPIRQTTNETFGLQKIIAFSNRCNKLVSFSHQLLFEPEKSIN